MSQLLLFLFGCTVSGIAALGLFLASKRAMSTSRGERATGASE